MKNLSKSIVALFVSVAAVLSVSSCSDDLSKSMVLSGQWEGDFGMTYDYSYKGRTYTFHSDYTDIVFYPDYDYATHGKGYQYDYYSNGPYVYQTYSFRWEIEDGVVYLTYPYNKLLNCSIRDYHMTNTKFAGYFGSSDVKFSLRKYEDYYDWTPYENTYTYRSRDNWYNYYTSVGVATKAVPADDAEGQIVKVYNRYNQ